MTVTEKFARELKDARLGRKAQAVRHAVLGALEDFCAQNKEFEQAVLQGGSTADCIENTVKGAGSSISDLEVYKRAAAFYFPTAKVHMTLTLDLGDGGFSGEDNPLTLSLDDLLDF